MDYLKFAGLCLLAGIVFLVCGIIFPGSYLGLALGLSLGLAITGAGFVRIRPAHFKIGYAIWIGFTLISCFGMRWIAKMYVRTELENIDYYFIWFVGCVLSNPVCYWLGRRLHFRMTRRRPLLSG